MVVQVLPNTTPREVTIKSGKVVLCIVLIHGGGYWIVK